MPRTDQFPAFSGPLADDDELFVLDHGETVTQKDKRINVAHARRQLVRAAFMEPRNPGPNDDETQDYAAGNFGINTATGALFTLVDASAGAAVWASAGSTFSGHAADVTYDPAGSGLAATDVQAAIDELAQGGGGATVLGDLLDVDTSGVEDADVLAFNEVSGSWVPVAPEAGPPGEKGDPGDPGPPGPGVPAGGATGHVLRKASSTDFDTEWAPGGGGGGAERFTDLTDAPNSFSGQGLRFVRVNAAATALEFTSGPTAGGQAVRHAQAGTFDFTGAAPSGSLEGDPVWSVTRINFAASPVAVERATGAWSDRENLSYS